MARARMQLQVHVARHGERAEVLAHAPQVERSAPGVGDESGRRRHRVDEGGK
jgi:hypothetical protein